ncbi:retrotransposon protein, putative, ty1-copia subclass [Tanacetum coccineum]
MHNMGKTIGELHALLIEYEKGLPKKAVTPQVMAIQSGRIQKANKKSQNAKGKGKGKGKGKDKSYVPKPKNPKPNAKEHPTKNEACHHCKEVGHWKRNCSVYLVELMKNKKQVGFASSSDNCHYAPSITRSVVSVSRLVENGFVQCFTDYGISVSRNNVLYFNVIPSNGIYEIDMSNSVPNDNSIYNVSNKRVKHNLDSTYLWHYRLAHISKKRIEKLQHDGLLKSTDDESFDQCVSCLSESAARILNMVPTKKVWGCEALVKRDTSDKLQERSKNLLSQEVNGRAGELEEIQDEDTSPSEITSEIPMEVEGFEPPQEEEAPVCRSERPHRDPNRLCLNVEVEEHTIRILIAIAAFYDYEIWQMDVKTAFLNGYLDEDIYMVQPEGFIDPKHPRKVCKLQRSIYGLKQASRSWNKRFDEEIKRFGFTQNLDEPCVYQKASGRNVTFLILYVDDIIIMGNHIPSLQSVKAYLGKCFAMKDLGEAAFILGIKIYRDRSRRLIGLCQSAYMDKILKRYRMDNSKRGYIPMQERLDLNKTQGASTPREVKRMQNVPYASAVGSIMYAVRCTRPDVAFAQNITSRFQQNPGEPHWTAVKTILKYLRNTKDMFLVYGGNPEAELRVDCYCDAGFETDRDDTKSQT